MNTETIFLIVDVFYQETDEKTTAHVAGIRFSGIKQHRILNEYTLTVENVAPYQSGQFYKREMPCLLALIAQVDAPFDVIVIDGFVFLDSKNRAGLGKYLYERLNIKKPIIGIAKNAFVGMDETFMVYRGTSQNPLYVTTHAIDLNQAKQWVKKLAGQHRLPSIVGQVDKLSRTL